MATYFVDVEIRLDHYFEEFDRNEGSLVLQVLEEFQELAVEELNRALEELEVPDTIRYEASKHGHTALLRDKHGTVDLDVSGAAMRVLEPLDRVDSELGEKIIHAYHTAWKSFDEAVERSNEA